MAGNRGTILRQDIIKNNNKDSGKKITKKKSRKVSPEKKAIVASDLTFNRRYATNSSEQATASDFQDFSNRNSQNQAHIRRNSNIYLNAQKSKADIIHFRLQMNLQQAMQLEQAELAHVIMKEMTTNSAMLHILLENEFGADTAARLLKQRQEHDNRLSSSVTTITDPDHPLNVQRKELLKHLEELDKNYDLIIAGDSALGDNADNDEDVDGDDEDEDDEED